MGDSTKSETFYEKLNFQVELWEYANNIVHSLNFMGQKTECEYLFSFRNDRG